MRGGGLRHSGGRSREKGRRHLDAPVLKGFAEILDPSLDVIADRGTRDAEFIRDGLMRFALQEVSDDYLALLWCYDSGGGGIAPIL